MDLPIPAPTETIRSPAGPVAWAVSEQPVPYPAALAAMEARVAAIRAGEAPETIWLLEHPPLYTAGTSAKAADLLDPLFPVYATGRGGQFTYHGPGQRIAYVMLNLARRGGDVRAFVCGLEDWVIGSLAAFGVRAERRPGRVGVWVPRNGGREDKIAAIGVRVRHGITFHGVSVNLEPDLSHYGGIVPCGIAASDAEPFGVTSLVDLGLPVSMPDLDAAMRACLEDTLLARLVSTCRV